MSKGRNAHPDGVKNPPADPIPTPEIPTWLATDEVARAEWDRVAPLLAKSGALANIDTTALAAYCACYSHWVKAEQFIQANGVFNPDTGRESRALGIADKLLKQIRGFCIEFGLTPSSRGRSRMPKAPKGETSAVMQFADE